MVAINVVIFHNYLPNSQLKKTGNSFTNRKMLPDNLFSREQTEQDWSAPVSSSITAKAVEELDESDQIRKGINLRANNPSNTIDLLPQTKVTGPRLRSLTQDTPGLNGGKRTAVKTTSSQSTNPDFGNVPVAPTIAPAKESSTGSYEPDLSTSIQRVAPITSKLQTPNPQITETPQSSEVPDVEVLTRSLNQSQPLINNMVGVRGEPSKISTINRPPITKVDSPGAESRVVETITVLSPRKTADDVARDSERNRTNFSGSIPETPRVDDRISQAELDELQPTLLSGTARPDTTTQQMNQRSIRSKLQTNLSFLPSSNNPLKPLSNRGFSKGNIASGDIPEIARLPKPEKTFSRKGDPKSLTFDSGMSNGIESKIFSESETLPSTQRNKEKEAPTVASLRIASNLPDIGSNRRPRPLPEMDRKRSPISLPKPQITPAPSFSKRVLRMTDSPPGESPISPNAPSSDTENAIELGLSYLASTQNEDGSWSLQGHGQDVILQSDTAATGLAVLAFQGAGYTHQRDNYSTTILRGIQFLVDHQANDGNLYRKEDQISNQNVAFYSHGIASLALCEAYGMTRDANLKSPAQRSLDYISNTQHRQRGGWRYNAQVSSDTSVSGWMMMALKSGELSGLETQEKTYQGISFWLSLAQSDQNGDRYRYNPFAPDTPTQRHGRLPSPTMTSVAALMRMYSGWTRDTPELQSIADYLLEYPPRVGSAENPMRDTYYWYYATQVMFHMGNAHWKTWNDELTPILVDTQTKSGPLAGSWNPNAPVPDRWSAHAGRLYVTAMNLLNLEVYYRHLPIYEQTANGN